MSNREARAIASSNRPPVSLRARWEEALRCIFSPEAVQTLLRIYEYTSGLLSHVLFLLIIYACMWCLTGKEALPPICVENYERYRFIAFCEGGITLNILIYYAFATLARQLTERKGLPGWMVHFLTAYLEAHGHRMPASDFIYDVFLPFASKAELIGMVTSGFILYYWAYKHHDAPVERGKRAGIRLEDPWFITQASILLIDYDMAANIRQIALATILIRAGLNFDPTAVGRIAGGFSRMSVIPCFAEAMFIMIISKFYFYGSNYAWCAMLGFILAARSTTVFVPSSMQLRVVAWGVDDFVVIIGFEVALSLAQRRGFANNSFLLVYLVEFAAVGLCLALLVWVLPHPGMEHGIVLRCSSFFLAAVTLIAGTVQLNIPFAGAVACILFSLTFSLVCQWGWIWYLMPNRDEMLPATARERDMACLKTMRSFVNTVWWFVQPLLFSLLGAEIQMERMSDRHYFYNLAHEICFITLFLLCTTVVFRVVVTFVCMHGSQLTFRQRLFCAMAWMPKTTVVAAIGGLAIDARRSACKAVSKYHNVDRGNACHFINSYQIVQFAMAYILIISPLWGALLTLVGPRLLTPGQDSQERENVDRVERG